MSERRVEFNILGTLSVTVAGEEVATGGPKQRALPALLLLHANRVVSRERPVGELLPEQSANGVSLATTSTDGNIRLWDLRSRRLLGSPLAAAQSGGWGMFTPGGERFVAVFGSGVGVIWNVDPVAWARHACLIAHRSLTRAEWHDFVPQLSCRKTCA